MPKLQILIKQDNFEDFLSKLESLSKISDTIKIKIDYDNILMYSIVGETIILAFKSYIIDTDKYLLFKEPIDFNLDIIVANAKRYVKNLSFIKKSEKIKLEVDYREDDEGNYQTRFINIKNGKLKIGLQAGENFEIKDITKEALEKRLDIKNEKWSFKVSSSDFNDIKKLSSINSDSRIINLSIDNGKVLLSENSTWEIQVDEIEESDKNLMFNKNLLSAIIEEDYINFHIFENFILTKSDISNLMISFEQDFSAD
jgi:hypothetical protein